MRILFLVTALCFAACHSPKKITQTKRIGLDDIIVSANNNPISIYRESAPRSWDILHTHVALSFDLKARTAEGRAWISLEPYCCTQDSLVLDAKSMIIDTVRWVHAGDTSSVPFTYRNDQLIIQRRVVAQSVIIPDYAMKPPPDIVYIRYKALPYADTSGGGSKAISEARGLYFINTDNAIKGKPAQIWTQGETESNSHWMPTIDKPNERFTTHIELTVPDSFLTLSNGELVKSTQMGHRLRTDSWQMNKPIQPYAVMFAIGKFTVTRESWQPRLFAGKDQRAKEIAYYTEPDYSAYAKGIFKHTPQMMDFFSDITGVSYPWNKYSQIVVRDYVSGAMENTSASLFGEFMNQNARELADADHEDIVAHELSHQWFGDYVTAESWSNLTLSESFANYGEQLWRRHYYGPASADELALEDLNKYLQSAEKGNDPELVRYNYRDKEDMFDRISYNKGGAILNYMHGLLGDTTFYRAMHLYLTKNAGTAEASDWRKAVELASGQDWNTFFNQWYFPGGHPELDVSCNYDDALAILKVTVSQRPSPDSTKLYRLFLKTALVSGKNKTIIDWDLKSRSETFTYPYQNGVRPFVIPDYYHWLPGVITEHKTTAQWLAQYEVAGDYINKHRALSYAGRHLKEKEALQIIALALTDSITGIRGYALGLLTAIDDEVSTFTRQVQYLAMQDPSPKVRTAAINVLNAWKVAGSRSDMELATADSSYFVAGAALRGLYNLDKRAGYSRAKELLQTNPRSALDDAIWEIIAEQGTGEDFTLFREREATVYGGKKVELAGYLAVYLVRVQDLTVLSEGQSLLDKMFQAEQSPSYRESIFEVVLAAGESLQDAYSSAKTSVERQSLRLRANMLKAIPEKWIIELKEQAMKRDYLEKAFKL